MKPIKHKTCKECKAKFTPARPLQVCCSPKCAIERATKQRKTKEKKEYRAAKEKQKSRSDWIREAQQAFNSFIRKRDELLPCISCGRYHDGAHDAGHYRTAGANPELRFNEDNCHRQCVPCNQHLHGNVVNYRIRLVQRIGLERVELLEGPHEPKKYTIDELKSIKETYKQKLKALK